MALNHYESVGLILEKITSRDLQGSFQRYLKCGPRTQSSTWDWSKCRILGPAQLLWSRISILTGSSGDFIHLKVWQALLSGTGEDKKRNYKSGPKCEGISGIRRLDDDWERNKKGKLQFQRAEGRISAAWVVAGGKKKAEQSLATFGHQKKKKKTEEKCEGEKEKKSVPWSSNTKLFQAQEHFLFHWKLWGSSASSLLLSDKIDDSLEKYKFPNQTEEDKDRLKG